MPPHDPDRTGRLAAAVTGDFYGGKLDLAARRGVPPGAGTWEGMPEVVAVGRLRECGASDREVRRFLTFVAAMDRARDANRLWSRAAELFGANPEVFEPGQVARNPVESLSGILARAGVSQRHGPDARAWHVIAQNLSGERTAVVEAVETGGGDAKALLSDLRLRQFPMLRGPKIGPLWVRMLAAPGGARITGLQRLPVQVDVQVRRATRRLGVADPRGRAVDAGIRRKIQDAWRAGVEAVEIDGPPGLARTCAALDPALWTLGKYGCSHCEAVGQRVPVCRACEACQFAC